MPNPRKLHLTEIEIQELMILVDTRMKTLPSIIGPEWEHLDNLYWALVDVESKEEYDGV